MSQHEQENLNFGTPDLQKDWAKQEEIIRTEVNARLPHLSPEARESIIQSRLSILINPTQPKIVQVDLGENASRKVKENLFE
jgi:hypothetical protein